MTQLPWPRVKRYAPVSWTRPKSESQNPSVAGSRAGTTSSSIVTLATAVTGWTGGDHPRVSSPEKVKVRSADVMEPSG